MIVRQAVIRTVVAVVGRDDAARRAITFPHHSLDKFFTDEMAFAPLSLKPFSYLLEGLKNSSVPVPVCAFLQRWVTHAAILAFCLSLFSYTKSIDL